MSRPVADVIEDLEFLDEAGVGALEAAERIGFRSAHAMEKWLQRHDAQDLWLSLKKRDPEGAHTADGIGRQRFDGIGGSGRIDALLVEASKSPLARTRKRGQKIRDLIEELASILSVEREEIAAKEEARKEVEKLERQLAAAKARLKSAATASAPTSTNGPSAAEIRAWASANNVACPRQGRIPGAVRDAYFAANERAAS